MRDFSSLDTYSTTISKLVNDPSFFSKQAGDLSLKDTPSSDSKRFGVLEDIERSDFNEMLEELNLDNLKQEDKDLFFNIVEDRYMSTEEIESLSYEQAKKIKELIVREDSNGAMIEASFVNASYKAKNLLATSNVSTDETFNKAVHSMIKDLDTVKEIESFMVILAEDSSPYYEKYSYKKGLDAIDEPNMADYLKDKIKKYENLLKGSLTPNEQETYSMVLSYYEKLQGFYNIEKQNVEVSLQQALYNHRPNPLELLKTEE